MTGLHPRRILGGEFRGDLFLDFFKIIHQPYWDPLGAAHFKNLWFFLYLSWFFIYPQLCMWNIWKSNSLFHMYIYTPHFHGLWFHKRIYLNAFKGKAVWKSILNCVAVWCRIRLRLSVKWFNSLYWNIQVLFFFALWVSCV